MKKIVAALVLSSAFLFAGCDSLNYIMTYSSPTNLSPEELNNKFQKLSHADNVYDGAVVVRGEISDGIDFDENSKVYDFESGTSVFKTYSLPLNATNINIKVETKIGQSMFAPSIALLNKQKQLVKIFGFSSFEYKPFDGLAEDNAYFRFSLNNFSAGENAIAYMVVYMDDADLESKTTIIHPAKLYAIAHKTDVPDLVDPQIPHARLGHIDVSINLENTAGDVMSELWNSLKGPIWGGTDRTVIADSDDGAVNTTRVNSSNIRTEDGNGVVVVNPNKDTQPQQVSSVADVIGGSKTAVVAKGTMLKETEEMYNNMIRDAVKAGNISKAVKLAGEATNAGSETANATLNKAMQSRK